MNSVTWPNLAIQHRSNREQDDPVSKRQLRAGGRLPVLQPIHIKWITRFCPDVTAFVFFAQNACQVPQSDSNPASSLLKKSLSHMQNTAIAHASLLAGRFMRAAKQLGFVTPNGHVAITVDTKSNNKHLHDPFLEAATLH